MTDEEKERIGALVKLALPAFSDCTHNVSAWVCQHCAADRITELVAAEVERATKACEKKILELRRELELL